MPDGSMRSESTAAVAPLSVGLVANHTDAWLAGVIYVANVLMTLDALPAAERPAITLLTRDGSVHKLLAPFVERGAAQVRRMDETRVAHRALRRLRRETGVGLGLPHPDLQVIFPASEGDASDRRRLYWVPDFQQEHLPHLFSEQALASRRAHLRALTASDGHVLLSSRTAAADLRRLYPGSRLVPHVWSFCSILRADEADANAPELRALPEKFLYVANQFWAHKDHRSAFRALGLLMRRGLDVALVCTGRQADPRRPEHWAELERLIASEGIAGRVHLLGLVPRATQIEIFRRAAAVLQPSLFEGWSTVVEDARSLGRPVILSDIPVHQEQMPDATFFKAGDAEALAEVIAAHWPGLRPGPDPASEARAAADLGVRGIERGRALMSVFREVARP